MQGTVVDNTAVGICVKFSPPEIAVRVSEDQWAHMSAGSVSLSANQAMSRCCASPCCTMNRSNHLAFLCSLTAAIMQLQQGCRSRCVILGQHVNRHEPKHAAGGDNLMRQSSRKAGCRIVRKVRSAHTAFLVYFPENVQSACD